MNARPDSFLEDLRIAKPCSADWSQMSGDDRARFCGQCQKHVYDLRAMTRQEAEQLLRDKGEACVRMARRSDGTVITGDCPVGVKSAARRQRVAAVLGGGLLAASALLWKVRAGAEGSSGRPVAADVDDEEDDDVPARPRKPAAPPERGASPAGQASPDAAGFVAWIEGLAAKLLSPPAPQPEPVVMGEIEPMPRPTASSLPPAPPPPRPEVHMGKVSVAPPAPSPRPAPPVAR